MFAFIMMIFLVVIVIAWCALLIRTYAVTLGPIALIIIGVKKKKKKLFTSGIVLSAISSVISPFLWAGMIYLTYFMIDIFSSMA